MIKIASLAIMCAFASVPVFDAIDAYGYYYPYGNTYAGAHVHENAINNIHAYLMQNDYSYKHQIEITKAYLGIVEHSGLRAVTIGGA